MRRLALLFLAVIVPVAGTLIWLGVKALDEDRVAWERQKDERRKSTKDRAVQSLDHSLTVVERALIDPVPIPEGAVKLTIASGEVHAKPPGRLAWLPVAPKLNEAAKEPFHDADISEAHGVADLDQLHARAASDDPAIRAGAYLRLARVSRNARNWSDAITNYRSLAAMDEIVIEGAPADLVARRAIRDVLATSGRKAEWKREADAIESDLLAGKWEIDQAEWELTGGGVAIPAERRALSEAADWFYEERGRLGLSRRTAEVIGDSLMTFLWRSSGSQITAIVLPPSVIDGWAQGLQVKLLSEKPESGLPWGVTLGPLVESKDAAEFATRRQLLTSGLAAIVLLLAGGSYFLWRVVQRELAVARLQTDFVSAVSHEFRTPLASLQHVTELLEEKDDLPGDRRQSLYGVLGRSTTRLNHLVESLLDFSRMENGKKPYLLQAVDARELATAVASEFQRESGCAIGLSVPEGAMPLRADAAALTHVLWNLLDNAMKYSPDHGAIELSVRQRERSVAIAVRDEGLGIPRRERREIFRKFVRGEQARKLGIKGTGLGLAMVSHIVKAHGGAIEVESEEGRGSTFRVMLPMQS